MARQRRLDGNIGRLAVGISPTITCRGPPEDRAQPRREGEGDLRVDLVWPTPSTAYSNGSSTVRMLRVPSSAI